MGFCTCTGSSTFTRSAHTRGFSCACQVPLNSHDRHIQQGGRIFFAQRGTDCKQPILNAEPRDFNKLIVRGYTIDIAENI
jgi:hypothetical protein